MESKIISSSVKFHFIALAAVGEGLSGGDRIFIELARRWSKSGHVIHIYTWQEGYNIIRAQNLSGKNIHFHILDLSVFPKFGFFVNYLTRIVVGIYLGLTLKIKNGGYVYSCSDFLMDSLPAWILKLRHPKIIWFAGWYQTAPNPLKGYTEGSRKRAYHLTAFWYWLSQAFAKPPISKWANFVLINNENEKVVFPRLSQLDRTVVVLGAVDVDSSLSFQKLHSQEKKMYDALFVGRFHPQKGVLEMVEIWDKVTKVLPNAQLGMIGDGELMPGVKAKIKQLKLVNNITLFGYVYDGPYKYEIFNQSKLVVHPAFYDSGGMFSAEAMVFGLPVVGFDLSSYASYYPQGMLKIRVGDLEAMAQTILKLLKDSSARVKLGQQAKDMIVKNWSWDIRASQVLKRLIHDH